MIKNVVFDLGNVLISFRPPEFLDKINFTEPLKSAILTDIFHSSYWMMLDSGDLTTDEALEGIKANSTLDKALIDEIFERRIEILIPIPSNIRLLPELKKHGYRLFYLSNFPNDLWSQVRNGHRAKDYEFFKYFDGGLISAEARSSKPDKKIYNDLLQKYSLVPQECFYLDDIEKNVRSAELAGMKGFTTFGSHEIYPEVKRMLGI